MSARSGWLGRSLFVLGAAAGASCAEGAAEQGAGVFGGGFSGGIPSSGSTATASGSGAGGSGGGGGAGAEGGGGSAAEGGGGAGGGNEGCPVIPVTDGVLAECATAGALAAPHANTTSCTADSAQFWPAKIYRVPVTAGDCIYMRADNAGSPAGADLFGSIVDPAGKSLLLDDELDCSVDNPEGFGCPEGGTTIETTGDAHVVVGAWEGQGCPPGETSPFQLTVSVNGVDVDLSAGELCEGDLLQIIP